MVNTVSSFTSRVIYGFCFVCGQYRLVFHQVRLPRSGRLLVRYCYDCFE